MKLRSGELEDSFQRLNFELGQRRTPATRALWREVNREYPGLHEHFWRLLRAVDRGVVDRRSVHMQSRMRSRCA
jgi:hypothetical protein